MNELLNVAVTLENGNVKHYTVDIATEDVFKKNGKLLKSKKKSKLALEIALRSAKDLEAGKKMSESFANGINEGESFKFLGFPDEAVTLASNVEKYGGIDEATQALIDRGVKEFVPDQYERLGLGLESPVMFEVKYKVGNHVASEICNDQKQLSSLVGKITENGIYIVSVETLEEDPSEG